MTDKEEPTQDTVEDQPAGEFDNQEARDEGIGDEGEGSGQVADEAGGPDEASESSRRGIPGYQ